jgi:hypothetical protein
MNLLRSVDNGLFASALIFTMRWIVSVMLRIHIGVPILGPRLADRQPTRHDYATETSAGHLQCYSASGPLTPQNRSILE